MFLRANNMTKLVKNCLLDNKGLKIQIHKNKQVLNPVYNNLADSEMWG